MRKLKSEEIPLVKYLLQKSGLESDISDLKVTEMNDGGMESLRFHSKTKNPKFGEEAAEYWFQDKDGIDVTAILNLDQNGELFELDVCKTDFSKLIQWQILVNQQPNKRIKGTKPVGHESSSGLCSRC